MVPINSGVHLAIYHDGPHFTSEDFSLACRIRIRITSMQKKKRAARLQVNRTETPSRSPSPAATPSRSPSPAADPAAPTLSIVMDAVPPSPVVPPSPAASPSPAAPPPPSPALHLLPWQPPQLRACATAGQLRSWGLPIMGSWWFESCPVQNAPSPQALPLLSLPAAVAASCTPPPPPASRLHAVTACTPPSPAHAAAARWSWQPAVRLVSDHRAPSPSPRPSATIPHRRRSLTRHRPRPIAVAPAASSES